MVGKIHAAVDARHSERTLIVARTDAVAVEGLAAALERAARYRDAGADMLFIEAPTAKEQLAQITATIGGSVPLMVNLVEGGKTPSLPANELEQLGFSLAIFPGGIVRALARTAVDYYASLATHRSTEPFRSRMYNFSELNELLGTPDMLDRGQRYAPDGAATLARKGRA
jgi:2-methylisocitrate lyase-like PEP mutase family enzyme